jgi:hypothetical protein
MKITAVALAVLAFAGSAHAYMFTPKHKKFQLNGTVTFAMTEVCTLNATGTTQGERATITSFVLSSDVFNICKYYQAHGLPWKVEMSDGGQPNIKHVRFESDLLGRTGTHLQAVTVDGSGNWTFTPSGHLQMSGTVASTPPITIKP